MPSAPQPREGLAGGAAVGSVYTSGASEASLWRHEHGPGRVSGVAVRLSSPSRAFSQGPPRRARCFPRKSRRWWRCTSRATPWWAGCWSTRRPWARWVRRPGPGPARCGRPTRLCVEGVRGHALVGWLLEHTEAVGKVGAAAGAWPSPLWKAHALVRGGGAGPRPGGLAAGAHRGRGEGGCGGPGTGRGGCGSPWS